MAHINDHVVPNGDYSGSKHSDTVVRVHITAVDGDPGALQSGHYIWPAAPALARHLVNACSGMNQLAGASKETCGCMEKFCHWCGPCHLARFLKRLPVDRPLRVVELGAGCGLAGLVAMQTLSARHDLSCFAFTDHDPGALCLSEENYNSTLQEVMKSSTGAPTVARNISSIPTAFKPLKWGDQNGVLGLKRELLRHCPNAVFDLVLGSDLIYCHDIVRPLLCTALDLMSTVPALDIDDTGKGRRSPESPFFLMSQSFPYEQDTEQEIDSVCNELGLRRNV
eukprot:CAMPEP_0113577062 /NCGR_PEP_ID=MMETSP0015_2-20120614/28667_1 /TAXON_ID=2838 /ORGANISM="Odontella" /LENGTH=280 /DNA_ID=CAMNT_0000480615 /DNA_START=107 /DNA_END=946 /DNA_ORIENTATION=- /assembly_acc=CAM_ASM_000160